MVKSIGFVFFKVRVIFLLVPFFVASTVWPSQLHTYILHLPISVEILGAISLSLQAVTTLTVPTTPCGQLSHVLLGHFYCWAIQAGQVLTLAQAGQALPLAQVLPTQRIVLDRLITPIYGGTHNCPQFSVDLGMRSKENFLSF